MTGRQAVTDGYHDFSGRPSFAMPTRAFVGSLLLWLVLLAVFHAFPGIDMFVARSVFTAVACTVPEPVGRTCGDFSYARAPILVGFRTFTLYLPYFAAGVLLLSLVLAIRRNGARWSSLKEEASLAALIAFVLGCGLIVNAFLKEFAGRPRPRDTDLFGGAMDFVSAGSFAGDCLRNCSFVSGEASSGGWLFCLIPLLSPRFRSVFGVPLLAIAVLMPTFRVVTGAHYMSDAVLGWLSSLVVFLGVLALFARLGSSMPVAVAAAAAEELEAAARAGRTIGGVAMQWFRRGRDGLAQGVRLLAAPPTRSLPASRALLQRPEAVLAIALAVSVFLVLRIDYPIGVWMRVFPDELNGIVKWFSDLGTGQIVLVPVGLFLLLRACAPLEKWPEGLKQVMYRATAPASYVFLSVAGGGLVASLVKNIIGRARPGHLQIASADHFQPFAFTPGFASFPSGHSATAGAMAFSLALLFPRLRPLFIAIGLLICLSRQMIGAHWPSDTVMGWAVGGAFALWMAHVFTRRGLVFAYGAEGQILPQR